MVFRESVLISLIVRSLKRGSLEVLGIEGAELLTEGT